MDTRFVRFLVAETDKTAWSTTVQRFACGGCGYEGFARISGAGYGKAASFGIVTHGARSRARARAELGAARDALRHFKRIRCPKCSWQDPEEVATQKRNLRHVRAMAIASMLALTGILWAAHPGDVGLILVCVLIPGTAILLLIGFIVELASEPGDGRATFLTEKEIGRLREDENGALREIPTKRARARKSSRPA